MTVSLVKFDGSLDSLRKSIELCNGFKKLDSDYRILIKPNNCFRHPITPPYGMVTTTRIIDLIIQLLLEYGCRDISIGEGCITGILDELEPHTKRGFRGSGVDKLAAKYGVKLIDFNEGPFDELDLNGTKVQVCRDGLQADFLINVPVLKTHFQTKVSLGFKNMKGCLSKRSKKQFHISNRLEELIALLNESVKSDLVIIDGTYMLEKGPETIVGTAHRKDLVIASTDIFECDVIATTVLGIDPSEVRHLGAFAQRNSRSFDISQIEIKGESIEPLKEQLEWHFVPHEELSALSGVTGLSAPHPGNTMCSGCGATLLLAMAIIAKDNPNLDCGGVELCYGLELRPTSDTRNALLYGKCALRVNTDLHNATRISGCPPTLTATVTALTKALLSRPRRLWIMLLMAAKLVAIRLRIYREVVPGWKRYKSKEFEKAHF
jgi:uncharacterized protein (DUF362 family)